MTTPILLQQEIDHLMLITEQTCIKHCISIQEINEAIVTLGKLSDYGYRIEHFLEYIKKDPEHIIDMKL